MPEATPIHDRIWGGSRAFVSRIGAVPWADVLVGLAVAGTLLAVVSVAQEFGKARLVQQTPIHLELPYLALYTLYSLARGLLAYVLSLGFAIAYGYWAAKDPFAEKLLLPLLDILQSLPVLAFMPGLMLALVYLFPRSEVGLNLASVLLIFTGQAWNMVFSFYHSVKTVPPEFYEVGQIYRFGLWRRFSRIELPFSAVGLIWNSMMSMAGGWFFLMVCEAFDVGELGFHLEGLGSYMSVAQDQGDYAAMAWAVLAMVLMIVLMNQLLWRPLTVWAQRFKTEDVAAGQREESRILDLLRRSQLLWLFHGVVAAPVQRLLDAWDLRQQSKPEKETAPGQRGSNVLRFALWMALLALAGWGLYQLGILIWQVTAAQWGYLAAATGLTFVRVLAAVALGTLWMVPVGVLIGLRPRLAGFLQPAIQVAASFPAPMLFALFLLLFDRIGLDLSWGSVFLMTAGTQWYILFNVLGGAMSIPGDLHEAAAIYRWTSPERWRYLYLPAIFPFLITGWLTAAGGAWNTSIVAEYWKVVGKEDEQPEQRPAVEHREPDSDAERWEQVLFDGRKPADSRVRRAFGLGAIINRATNEKKFPLLAAGALLMAATVVAINRLLWRRLERLAEKRFSLSR
jgi:NitT/TauT family transport system permease protein